MLVHYIDTDTDKGTLMYRRHMKLDSPLFQAIEKRFDAWIEGRGEYEDMYFSEDAIYTKKGAIKQAIESIFESMREDDLKFIDLNKFDVEASFE